MKKRVLLLLNDAAASRNLRKLLNALDYKNVEIMTSYAIDSEAILRDSPDLVIIGSDFIENDNAASCIQRFFLLDMPVVFISSSAEDHLLKHAVRNILDKITRETRPIQKHLLEEIFQGNGLFSNKRKADEAMAVSLKNDDNALFLLKELKCMFLISDLMSIPDISIDAVIRYIHVSIEKAIGYNDDVKVRITCHDSVYVSDNFSESRLKIESPIIVNGRDVGEIEVFYYHHSGEKKYLLKMETDLVNAISERIGNFIKEKEAIRELKARNEELRNLSSHLQSVREDERKMVASTIHDEFGQKLIMLRYEVLNLRRRLPENDREVDSSLCGMLGIIDESIQTVRKISSDLRPGVLDKLGIAAAIEWLAQDIESRTGIRFTVIISHENLLLNDDYTTVLFRIFQEATTNIVRHSGATEVFVNLKMSDSDVFLVILDNGKGISEGDINRSDSFGIKGMRERVLSFQGHFSIENNSEGGTVLKVSLPIWDKIAD